MQHQWIEIDGQTLIIGINSDAMDSLETVKNVYLPSENDQIGSMRSFGEVEGKNESLSLYCPYEGKVLELNEAVIDTPSLLNEDCIVDGWIIKISVPDGVEVTEKKIKLIQDSQ